MENKTARELVSSRKEGKIVEQWEEDGIKIMIVSLYSHFTAYFGLPINHPLSGFDYDSIPLNVHGGLTFGSKGSGGILPEDLFMYGWDYAHCGDYYFYELGDSPNDTEHDWTLKEVREEVKSALYDFKQLVKIAELINAKK